jgi:hypothetical protein
MFEMIKSVSALRVLGLLLGGVVATACATGGAISDGKVVGWVEKTIAERQPPAKDKLFDQIAWVTDIRTAIQLGKQYNRPIFLYTGDGRINTGRC